MDRLRAFKYGADDFVIKPFVALELRARVLARLRGLKNPTTPKTLDYPSLTIDFEKRRASLIREGKATPLKLTNIEFKLLIALCARPEAVKSRQPCSRKSGPFRFGNRTQRGRAHLQSQTKAGDLAWMIEASPGNGYCFFRSKKGFMRISP